MAGNKATTF